MKRFHMNHSLMKLSLVLLLTIFASRLAAAQGSAFSYQGWLTDGGNPAAGIYDVQFLLFDAAVGGIAISEPITNSNLQVTNGAFTVELGFVGDIFTGAARYLEVRIRAAGSPDPYTILSPRQQVLSVPYAVQSLRTVTAANSDQLGGIAPGGFIQNSSSQQGATNFNISGTGTLGGTLNANTVNTTTQYNINGSRALSVAGTNNLFVGLGTGVANTTGNSNTFVGAFAGNANTLASNNSFFGREAGSATTTGHSNSFFGSFAGNSNTTGISNSFFGMGAGFSNASSFNSFFGTDAGPNNTTGGSDSFFGTEAGFSNTTGGNNSFFGQRAGFSNTSGSNNTFVGTRTGGGNTTENNNTFIGYDAEATPGITNATAIGALAQVTQSNSLVLGSIAAVNGATATVNVGIGTTNPADRLHVNGIIRVISLGSAGSTQLCRNTLNQIATCSSSLTYKDQVTPFDSGLETINRLRPIAFAWKASGERDLGLAAEEVATLEPLLVTYNERGQVEGVKYDRIGVVLINAIRQQQEQIRRQQGQIDGLKQIVCLDHPRADLCR